MDISAQTIAGRSAQHQIERAIRASIVAVVLVVAGRALGGDSPSSRWTRSTVFRGSEFPFVGVAFSADSKTLVASDRASVRVWDVGAPEPRIVLPGKQQTKSGLDAPPRGRPREVPSRFGTIAISPDGRRIATGGLPARVTLWNVETGMISRQLEAEGSIRSFAFSPNGEQLAAGVDLGAAGNYVQVWNTADWSERGVLKGHRGRESPLRGGTIESLAYSGDGNLLVSGSWDGTVKLWDTQAMRELKAIPHEHPVVRVDLSSDGKTLVSSQWKRVPSKPGRYEACFTKIWDLDSGRADRTLEDTKLVYGVKFFPDATKVATGTQDRLLRIWDTRSGRELEALRHDAMIRAFAIAPNGRSIAVASHDRTVVLWTRTRNGGP